MTDTPDPIDRIRRRLELSYPWSHTDFRHDGTPVFTQMGNPVEDLRVVLQALDQTRQFESEIRALLLGGERDDPNQPTEILAENVSKLWKRATAELAQTRQLYANLTRCTVCDVLPGVKLSSGNADKCFRCDGTGFCTEKQAAAPLTILKLENELAQTRLRLDALTAERDAQATIIEIERKAALETVARLDALEAENNLMRDDLYAIGRALGIGAKPYSGHEAIARDFLPKIANLELMVGAAEGRLEMYEALLAEVKDAMAVAGDLTIEEKMRDLQAQLTLAESSRASLEAKLKALVGQWRAEATSLEVYVASEFPKRALLRKCAAALEAALPLPPSSPSAQETP